MPDLKVILALGVGGLAGFMAVGLIAPSVQTENVWVNRLIAAGVIGTASYAALQVVK